MFAEQETKEGAFLKKHFKEYYSKHIIDSVPEVSSREFGFGVFRRKIANRNIFFPSAKEMNAFLVNEQPLFLSYSPACYKFPDRRPMQAKELFKADLVYEFDADELGLEVPEVNGFQWFEKEHLDVAKKQVFRLLDFLENDFAFPMEGITINFSGKAGYHVHVRNKEIQQLNRKARIELVDYLTGFSDFPEKIGFNFSSKAPSCPTGRGLWGKRLNAGIKEFFSKEPKEIALLTGFPLPKVKFLCKSKNELFDSMEKGFLFALEGRKSPEFWKKVLELVILQARLPVDRQTSIDLHKIVRMPETLHGETGFLAKTLSVEELKKFDPFADAVVFGRDSVRLFIKKAPKFSLLGEVFGPFEEQEVVVPLFCAIYLIGKGAELR